MQIPLLAGVYVGGDAALRVAYPVNAVPVPGQDGIADGFLRPAEGIEMFATGVGLDRGALFVPSTVPVIGGLHYRVSGASLITVSSSGEVFDLGAIIGTDLVRMDYSFDKVGIAAGGLLYYWDGSAITQVTDPAIGAVNDALWIDSYWMVTDGTNIVVTSLTDPYTVLPFNFGTTDRPDPVACLLKVLGEAHIVSRHFIDVFENVGGAVFPFQRVKGALISKGAIGKRAACVFKDAVAFVGGGLNEAPSVYLGHNAQTIKISSREIDKLLLEYTEAQLAGVLVEAVVDQGSEFLFVKLPDRTAVYDAAASAAAQQPVWHFRVSTLAGFDTYRAQNFVRTDDAWISGDPTSFNIGKWTTTDSQHYGVDVRWEFNTPMTRNAGKGAIVKELLLTAVTGTAPALPGGASPKVSTSYSTDGKLFSVEKAINSGALGDTNKQLRWLQQGEWRNGRVQRFRGDSSSRLTALRLDAEIEPLRY